MKLSKQASIFKALSNEQRLKIFMMIYEGCSKEPGKKAVVSDNETTCCPMQKAFTKVCKCMKLSPSTISHHIKELQSAGLITCEREGQMFICKINEKTIDSIREFLK